MRVVTLACHPSASGRGVADQVNRMIELSHSVPVNEPADPDAPMLTRDDVWEGLVMKAENALPFVPKMEKCDVVERRENFSLRDIRFGGDDLREAVTLTPKRRWSSGVSRAEYLALLRTRSSKAPAGTSSSSSRLPSISRASNRAAQRSASTRRPCGMRTWARSAPRWTPYARWSPSEPGDGIGSPQRRG